MEGGSTHHEMRFASLALSIFSRLQDTDSRAFRLLDTGRQLAARFFGQCERRAGDNSQYTSAQDTCKRLTCITPCSGRCCPRYYETQRHWFSRERACRSGRRRAEEPG